MSGSLMTVEGPITPQEMGITLPHEHLLIRHQGPRVDLVDQDLAAREVRRFKNAGGRTIIDMTSIGIGRDAVGIRDISRSAGVQTVLGTGFYKDAWLPEEVHAMSVTQMEETMVSEIAEGVDGTGIRAGVIGEIGVSRPITATEERVLIASARAQRETGVAISVHFDLGTLNEHLYAIDILEQEGADLSRVVVDHVVPHPRAVEQCEPLVARGCYIEFELWGMHIWPKVARMMGVTQSVQIASLRWFIIHGMLDHILISQDVCNQALLVENGGFGYAHILNDLAPVFAAFGVSSRELERIMIDNPRRLFPVAV